VAFGDDAYNRDLHECMRSRRTAAVSRVTLERGNVVESSIQST
jgi:hypothetical protein